MKYILPFTACLPFVLSVLQYFRCSNALTRKVTTAKLTVVLTGTVTLQTILYNWHENIIIFSIACIFCFAGYVFVSTRKVQNADGRNLTKTGLRIGEKSGKAVGTAAGAAAGAVAGAATVVGTTVGIAAGSALGNAAGNAAGGVFHSIADKMDENDGDRSINIPDQAFVKLNDLSDSVAYSGAKVIDTTANANNIPSNISSAIWNTEAIKNNQIEGDDGIKSRNDFIMACNKLGIYVTDSSIDELVQTVLVSAPSLARTKLESMPDMSDYDKAVYVLERRYLQ